MVATDQHLHAFVTSPGSPAHGGVAEAVAEICHVPPHAVRVHHLAALPRTANGKVDRGALARLAALDADALPPTLTSDAPLTPEQWIVQAAAEVLGRDDADPLDSFVGLGGDSLSYVELAVQLEDRFGRDLPAQWHILSFGELAEQLAPTEAPTTTPAAEAVAEPAQARLDTTITLRALAIVAIVASHVDLVDWQGGAHLLLAVAGFNFARFQLGSAIRATRIRHGLTTLGLLLLPAVIWVGAVATRPGGYDATTVLMLNGALGSATWDVRWQLWFLEALVWIMLGAVALVAVPALHRWERRSPFGFALAVLAAAALVRLLRVGVEAGDLERYTTGVVAFFFALGWLAARADTTARRLLVTVLAAALTVGFFGDLAREAVVVAGIALVIWAPRLPVPRPVAATVGRVTAPLATYSLFVYLTHWQVYPPLEDAGHPWLALVASFAVGIAYGVAMRPLQRRLASWLSRSAPRRVPAEPSRRPASGERTGVGQGLRGR
ncbi:acyltransferase family protein [Nocardioides daphniae]|nr:acyltransferase family protein [Nocardioides daphniae]QCC77881.1 hypothetical protein E2C04_13070 [Nocardioides daphniae]